MPIHGRLDDSLSECVWNYLSWTDRQRASAVSRSWKEWHASRADRMVEKEWQHLCHRLDVQRQSRIRTRRALSDIAEKESLDLALCEAVHWMLLDFLGSTELQCFSRHPSQSTLHTMNKGPASGCREQLQKIQELLDAGASDTYLFDDADNRYSTFARSLSLVFDQGYDAPGPSRVDHFITMGSNDVYAWELVQEMAYSACEKWRPSGTSKGFQRFHCLLLDRWLQPVGLRVDPYQYARCLVGVHPTLESRERVFQTLCLAFRECQSLKEQWWLLPETLSELIEVDKEGDEELALYLRWTEPHARFRHRFFLHLFRRLVLEPEIRRVGNNATADGSSWLVDLLTWEDQVDLLTWELQDVSLRLLFALDCLQTQNMNDTEEAGVTLCLQRIGWDQICSAAMANKARQRQFRHLLRTYRTFRLAVMDAAGPFFLKRKDRKILLDTLLRLEPLRARVLLPEWIAVVQSRDVKGKKERLLKELLVAQVTVQNKSAVVAAIRTVQSR